MNVAAERKGTDEGTSMLVSTPHEDERLRVLIRKELDRQHAMPVARRTLELLAEAAAEPATSSSGYRIVDRHGETRLRPVTIDTAPKKGGKADAQPEPPLAPLTLVDLVEELRERHPDLFSTPPEPEPVPMPPPKEASHAVQDTVASVKATSARFVETQSVLARSLAAISAKRGRAFAAAASGTVEGWRGQLDERLKSRHDPQPPTRLPSSGSSTDLSPTAEKRSPVEEIAGRASATQSRGNWRSFTRGAVVALRDGRQRLLQGMRDRSGRAIPSASSSASAAPDDHDYSSRRRTLAIGLGSAAAVALIAAAATVARQTPSRIETAPTRQNETVTAQAPPASTSAQKDAPDPASGSSNKAAPAANPPQTVAPSASQVDPELQPSSEDATPTANDVTGVPEVVDTATLRLAGKTVRLFGVEWVRGGQAEELAKYLAGRKVTCQPAPGSSAYLCAVDGRDLSEVVLFNGGGRASSEATPDLAAAEDHARSERLGVWKR